MFDLIGEDEAEGKDQRTTGELVALAMLMREQ